ncbi:MAG: RluA family pseudouridine synthase [Xenococcaceae cyanobacterium MO_188.B19]|nr:RluA family pseudouridine synthase [Xenococcaceae cyanobacterium MO_188.B19]
MGEAGEKIELQVTDSNAPSKNTAISDRVMSSSKGERIDQWLSAQFPHISRSRLQKLIKDGKVEVNEQVCHSKKLKLVPGDRISLTIPPVEKLDIQPEAIPLDILYEDTELIIINKVAGMVVHPAPGHYQGTLVNALLHHCDNLAGIGGVERPGIVHRLDKDTTGAIVVAKSDRAHHHLQNQIKAKTARREYWGIVYGNPREEKGKIDLPIGRHPVERKKMAVVEKGGRNAITHWEVKERLGNYTLMEFVLETGRTHQIRVHSSYMGHPLVGDMVYGSNRSIGVNLSGQVLHARKLTLIHPLSEKVIEAIAPLPDDFTKLLSVLRAT